MGGVRSNIENLHFSKFVGVNRFISDEKPDYMFLYAL